MAQAHLAVDERLDLRVGLGERDIEVLVLQWTRARCGARRSGGQDGADQHGRHSTTTTARGGGREGGQRRTKSLGIGTDMMAERLKVRRAVMEGREDEHERRAERSITGREGKRGALREGDPGLEGDVKKEGLGRENFAKWGRTAVAGESNVALFLSPPSQVARAASSVCSRLALVSCDLRRASRHAASPLPRSLARRRHGLPTPRPPRTSASASASSTAGQHRRTSSTSTAGDLAALLARPAGRARASGPVGRELETSLDLAQLDEDEAVRAGGDTGSAHRASRRSPSACGLARGGSSARGTRRASPSAPDVPAPPLLARRTPCFFALLRARPAGTS